MDSTLEKYLSDGMERFAANAMRVTLRNPKQSAFFIRFARAAKKAVKLRRGLEQAGEHIPTFLIASITENCNLNCAGCYARATHQRAKEPELSAVEWARIFREAQELGVMVIILAGGEPMLRPDVLEAAARNKSLLFPVFTNGTMLDDKALRFFDANRNLVPVLSIEGGENATDLRRGDGIFRQAAASMQVLRSMGVPYGVSLTVTKENFAVITQDDFVAELAQSECKVVLYVEYVPFEAPELAMDDEDRANLSSHVDALRESRRDLIVVSFPGDEDKSGGCLAAGRGFFHISASGNAEPCPFSPYSDTSLRDVSVRDALKSPLFARLSAEDILSVPHKGGCVLFQQQDVVAGMAGGVAADG